MTLGAKTAVTCFSFRTGRTPGRETVAWGTAAALVVLPSVTRCDTETNTGSGTGTDGRRRLGRRAADERGSASPVSHRAVASVGLPPDGSFWFGHVARTLFIASFSASVTHSPYFFLTETCPAT